LIATVEGWAETSTLFTPKLTLGWYNAARRDDTGRRMDAAGGVDKLQPVRGET